MAEQEIREFLANLAVELHVSASTQIVALSALLFLYRDVLKRDLPYISEIERAKPSRRLPVVFSRAEVQAVLARLAGTNHLIASFVWRWSASDGGNSVAREGHRFLREPVDDSGREGSK